MKVLGIGETVLDKSIIINGYLNEGTKTNPQAEISSVGGPVPTALILLSRLGAQCTLVTTLAHDNSGKIIKNTLQNENITLVQRRASRTKTNVVLTNIQNGSRTIIKSSVTHAKLKKVNSTLIKEADLIVLDRHEPFIFDQILKHKKCGAKIIIDPSTEVSEYTLKMIKNVDYPIIPIESWESLRNEKLSGRLIITAGSDGSYILSKNKLIHEPPIKVKVADTLGAGDIYRGAFAYGILNNWTIKNCVRFANLVAALQCTKTGNATAIPTKQEIFDFMQSAKLKVGEKHE